MKIAFLSSWLTDSGVARHSMPLVEALISQGHEVKVFTHFKEAPFGKPYDDPDEPFVYRCYATKGKGSKAFDAAPIFKALDEGFNVLVVEDLGMLPYKELFKHWVKIREKAVTILVNHDNKPKPSRHYFWRFEWDAIINFLPEQCKFMAEHYDKKLIYLIEFPCYQVVQLDKAKLRKELNLPNKDIVLTLGEYNFIAPLKALDELRKKKGIFLVALVPDEATKAQIENLYDEVRVEKSYKERVKYVAAASLVVLDKAAKGKGAVISSTACQIMGWGTPILARESRWFDPLNTVMKYKNDEELKEKAELLLKDVKARKELIARARAYAEAHSPEKIAKQFIDLISKCGARGI